MGSRKGQLTIMIILGLILLILVSVSLYVISRPQDITVALQEEVIFAKEIESIDSFITACLKDISYPLAVAIAENGGSLEKRKERLYENKTYAYNCAQEGSFGCVPLPISRNSMEEELSGRIEEDFVDCLDLTKFEDRQIRFQRGIVNVSVIIGAKHIFVKVKNPIRIRWRDFERTIEDFNSNVEFELGTLYDLMRLIMNKEVENNTFDEALWMDKHNVEIEISKHKPYPDIVYELKKYDPRNSENFFFRFAIKGLDTGNSLIYPQVNAQIKGYCVEAGGGCIVNSPPADCREMKGFWHNRRPIECELDPTFNDPACEGEACQDCGYRQHGESWCVYDGMLGSGYDFSGTRHYKQSCFNGRIFNTECRDFRDEFCTEIKIDNFTTAVCRDNRWEDCSQQVNESSCSNTGLRDCIWRDWLNKSYPWECNPVDFTERRCNPQVSAGFKHWRNEGVKACALANEQKSCDEESCPQKWVDSTYIYCYAQGDCGWYYDSKGDLGDQKRWSNSDRNSPWGGKPRNYTYEIPFEQGDFSLSLELNTSSRADFGADVFDYKQGERQSLAKISQIWRQHCSKPRVSSSKIHQVILGTAMCHVWRPNETINICERCDNDPRKPCSEYKCRSMGTNCAFEEIEGFGTCITLQPDYDPPIIRISQVRVANVSTPVINQILMQDNENLTPYIISDLVAVPFKDFGLDGLKVQEPVDPFANIFITINSSEPVDCRIGASAISSFDSLQSFGGFQNETWLLAKATPPSAALREIRRTLGIQSPLAAFLFDTYKQDLDNIKRDQLRASSASGKTREAVADDFKRADENLDQIVGPALAVFRQIFQKMFIEFARNELTYHVICRDRFENEARVLFKFKVLEDLEPPKIVEIEPEIGTVTGSPFKIKLYLNEPAECRWKKADTVFESMENSFKCQQSATESQGLFECERQLTLDEGKNDFYVRCKDQPLLEKLLFINFEKGSELRIKGDEEFGIFVENEPLVMNGSYKTTRPQFNIRRDCVVHPVDVATGIVLFPNVSTTCKREGDFFVCPNGANMTSLALNHCDLIFVNKTKAPEFKPGVFARQDALEFNDTVFEVPGNSILLTLKLKSDFNCKYTQVDQPIYDELPIENALDCFQAKDNRHTCRGNLPIINQQENYKIICQEEYIGNRNTHLESTVLTYYKT